MVFPMNDKVKQRIEQNHKLLKEAMAVLSEDKQKLLASKLMKKLTMGIYFFEDLIPYAKRVADRYMRMYGKKED